MSASTPTPRPAGANAARVPRPARPSRWSYRFAAAVTIPLTMLLTASRADAAVPQPNGEQPPGTDGLITILDWGFWVVSLIGVGGLLGVAGIMMLRHNRGQGGESMGSLGWVLGGCVLATAAGPMGNVLF